MKTILIGLGNPILGDDGVGWKVVETVKEQIHCDSIVDVTCLSLGGISLMEHLIGYQRVILVDAFLSGGEVGSIFVHKLDEIPNYSAYHISSPHDTSLQSAIELGRWLGAVLPTDITVVGVSIRKVIDFSEELSPEVAAAIPGAARVVLGLLERLETI